ncbi:MAG: nickel ABC transporter ATP-binding protein NikE [Thermoleophilia bacterium]
MSALLEARRVVVEVPGEAGARAAVDGVDLDLHPGECLGLVGESGAGKTLLALSLLRLVPPPARARAERLALGGADLRALDPRGLRAVRGARIGLVPQDPAASLDPVRRVGWQVAETLRAHARMSRREAAARAAELLGEMGVDRDDHPHRLSGGQRQRALIAMALAPDPAVLVADEPTSGLDSVVRARILDLIDRHRRERGLAVLLISHDMGVIARLADRVAVMERGRIVEQGRTGRLLRSPVHPLTARLIDAAPRMAGPAAAPRPIGRARHGQLAHERSRVPEPAPAPPAAASGAPPPALELEGVVRTLGAPGREPVRAVDGVSLSVAPGEVVALVGGSGSGKTTLARLVVGLLAPEAGAIRLGGRPVGSGAARDRDGARRLVQIVFQDPFLSLDPRMTVGAVVAEPLVVHGLPQPGRRGRAGRAEIVAGLLEAVGLPAAMAGRRPAQLSGGERQRVAIARALALDPPLLVLDEPVSSLDAPVGVQVLDLLAGLRERRGVAQLLISHDLGAVGAAADRVAVMEEGRIVEEGPPAEVLTRPRHPATRELVEAARALTLPAFGWRV